MWQMTFNCTSWVLSRCTVKNVGCCPGRCSFTTSCGGQAGIEDLGCVRYTCACGRVDIGRTNQSVETRVKEHHCYIHMYDLTRQWWQNV